ncbi:hypothetical protein A1A1_01348 [Planococcus antarcticus DSM 14505]|uniref:Uncharacterized protein n=1 Tax=Planococcus antarcticus DSM 14505 TaxID=1185653 RepID=A0AA87IP82_9BACL|nr:hypothetical protein [Planococcus antarcticus]EIM08335.1 hypothetical protein A1A1_01348 [Planococcus antarcticus DSM 14505]
MVQTEKKKNGFNIYYSEYLKVMDDAKREEERLKKELYKEEERIRNLITSRFEEIKDTFVEVFTPSIEKDHQGQIDIKLREGFTMVFTLEVVENGKEFLIKLSTSGAIAHHRYYNYALKPQSTLENHKDFIENQFKLFLDQFIKFIAAFEKDKTLKELRRGVQAP